MLYITHTRENANNRQLREFNTNTYTPETLVLFCAVWTREDNDGTVYFLRDDDNDDEIIYPVHRTVYINGQRASLKDLFRIYHRRVSGSVSITMHTTREGSVAFDTDD